MKLKTNKALSKRVKVTSGGKLMRVKSAKSHLLTHKANPPKYDIELNHADRKNVKRMLPYLGK